MLHAYRQTLDQQVFAQLYLRYNGLVYGACLKYLEDAEAARDAVMDIYQELIEKIHTQQIENFKGWLYVVAKNHCLMQLRSRKKNITVSLDAPLMQSDEFLHLDNVLENEKVFKRLETCVEALSTSQRSVIQLFYYEHKCYNEIADATGLEWSKVRSMIQNARRNLKICMDKNG